MKEKLCKSFQHFIVLPSTPPNFLFTGILMSQPALAAHSQQPATGTFYRLIKIEAFYLKILLMEVYYHYHNWKLNFSDRYFSETTSVFFLILKLVNKNNIIEYQLSRNFN